MVMARSANGYFGEINGSKYKKIMFENITVAKGADKRCKIDSGPK